MSTTSSAPSTPTACTDTPAPRAASATDAPPAADASDATAAVVARAKPSERASSSYVPIEVTEAIKAFKPRVGIELRPSKPSESSIIFHWGVRFTYMVHGDEQLGWKCLASQSCREDPSFVRLFSGKTSSATKHLKEVHSIPSAPPRPPLTEAQEALSRMQREEQWRPHLLRGRDEVDDWIQDLNLTSAARFAPSGSPMTHKPRILVLEGSIRDRNFSRLLAYECARVLDYLGAHVRVFKPGNLPLWDPLAKNTDAKALELNTLCEWSEGHVWISTERHGQVSAAMKNQLDWVPETTSLERPMEGKTVVAMQVTANYQPRLIAPLVYRAHVNELTVACLQVTDEARESLSAVDSLRLLAQSMRMPYCTSTTCVPSISCEFDGNGRMKPSVHRDRVVDIMEEFFKFTLVFREHAGFFGDRFSGRKRKEASRYESFEPEADETKSFIRASHP